MKKLSVVNGAVLGINALLAAGIVWGAMTKIIFADPGERDARRKDIDEEANAPRVPPPPPENFNPDIAWRLPFPLKSAEKIAGVAPVQNPVSKYVELQYTMPGSSDRLGAAVLKVLAFNETRVYFIGQEITARRTATKADAKKPDPIPKGITLTRVEKDFAVFNNNGRVEQIQRKSPAGLPGSSKGGRRPQGPVEAVQPPPPAEVEPQPVPQPEPAPADPQPEPPPGQVPGVGQFDTTQDPKNPDRWVVDPREQEYIASNGEKLLNEMDLQPYAPNGNVQGFRVAGIAPGSLAADRGLQPDDVIRSINGKPLKSRAEADALRNDPAIRDSSMLVIEIERAGRIRQIQYQLRR